jgi:carbonic anhydrase
MGTLWAAVYSARMFKRILIGTAAIMATAAGSMPLRAEPHHWSYSGEGGPSHWAELDAKNAACGTGKSQSPIDILVRDAHSERLPALAFHYRPSRLHIIDNGHSIQVNVDPGSSLKVGDKTYQLVQFHFHHPSEERINGKGSPMVAHLVHRNSAGGLAVVAVLLNAGLPNATVESLWGHLPKQKGHQADFKDVRIDPAGLLPSDRAYFTYAGSLTTPPCSEGVRWFVLKTPSTLSKSEIATFAAHYPNDARPIQKLNGREVLATK